MSIKRLHQEGFDHQHDGDEGEGRVTSTSWKAVPISNPSCAARADHSF